MGFYKLEEGKVFWLVEEFGFRGVTRVASVREFVDALVKDLHPIPSGNYACFVVYTREDYSDFLFSRVTERTPRFIYVTEREAQALKDLAAKLDAEQPTGPAAADAVPPPPATPVQPTTPSPDISEEQGKAKLWAEISADLAKKNIKALDNLDEVAAGFGRWLVEVARIEAKWGKMVPPAGTPEASAYEQDFEKMIIEADAWAWFVADPKAMAPLADPDRLAQFQTLGLSAALGLNEDQRQQIHAALSVLLKEAQARGLSPRFPPQTGTADWDQALKELEQRASKVVKAFLSPEQSAVFMDAYVGTQATLGPYWLGGPVVTLSKYAGKK